MTLFEPSELPPTAEPELPDLVGSDLQVKRNCDCCGAEYVVAARELARGWGKCCSKRCANTLKRRMDPHLDTAGRFWAKVDRSGGEDACWSWTAGRSSRGYGAFSVTRYDRRAAHRFAYELTHGAVPEGLEVLHTCDNPPCCNPKHLFAGTPADNSADMVAKGRSGRGERNSQARLSAVDVQAIRDAGTAGEPWAEIAARFGITERHIKQLLRGDRWKHI